jgi:hypothetical protein
MAEDEGVGGSHKSNRAVGVFAQKDTNRHV